MTGDKNLAMSQVMPSKRTNGALVTLRSRLGLTQQDFAAALGLSTVTVSRLEHEHTRPTAASRALLGLLERAVSKHGPPHVADEVRKLAGVDETNRLVALVHLGD